MKNFCQLRASCCQRQELLDNHLPRVLISPRQQGTHEMRSDLLSSVGAQAMDTSRCQVSDLDDIEFLWDKNQLEIHGVPFPGTDTPFSPKAFDELEMGGSAENPFLLDDEEDKEEFPPSVPQY